MNKYVKQCEQCKEYNESVQRAINKWGYCNEEKSQEWYNFKDVKFFPKVNQIETFQDGSTIHQYAPDRYYCKNCIEGWKNCFDGFIEDEMPEKPIKVEVIAN